MRANELATPEEARVARSRAELSCVACQPGQLLTGQAGNRSMARFAQRVAAAREAGDQRSPETLMLADALKLARARHPIAEPLLARALAAAERQPPATSRTPTPSGPLLSRCACGGVELPGGECADCTAARLTGQGMPPLEVRRVVAARQQLARSTRILARKRSFGGCVNANLACAGIAGCVLVIIGGACGLIGAIGGILAAAPTAEGAAPATVPMGMLLGAAVCVAGITGFGIGAVLTVMQGCAADTDFQSAAASTASNDGPEGLDPATAAA